MLLSLQKGKKVNGRGVRRPLDDMKSGRGERFDMLPASAERRKSRRTGRRYRGPILRESKAGDKTRKKLATAESREKRVTRRAGTTRAKLGGGKQNCSVAFWGDGGKLTPTINAPRS